MKNDDKKDKAMKQFLAGVKKHKNMTVKQFVAIHGGNWHLNDLCPKCGKILHNPLKNFTDCYLDLGVTGDKNLTKACEDYQEVVQRLWGLIAKHKFEFLEED